MKILINEFLKIWNLLNDKYVLFEEKNVNWDNIKKIYIDKIKENHYSNIYNIIEDMLIELKDPHTKLVRNNNITQYISPIEIYNLLGNDYYVISNRKSNSNINIGDKLLSVNGLSMDKLLMQIRNKYNYTSENVLKFQLVSSITRSLYKENLKLKVFNGISSFKETVEFTSLSQFASSLKYKNLNLVSLTVSNVFNNDIAYIKPLNFMIKSISDNTLKELSKIKNCSKLIVDLRGNTGGLINEAKRFAGLFISKTADIGYESTGKDKVLNKIIVEPNTECILNNFKNIVFLCDKETMSSAEFIVLKTIRKNTSIPIIGTKTCGMPHSATVFNLSDKSRILVTTIKYIDNNKIIVPEGGIIPDIEINNDVSLILKRKDIQLKYAVDYLDRL